VGSYRAPAAFSPDGRWLAVARDTIVVVHDVVSRTTPSVLSGGGNQARSFTWTGDWLVFSGGTALEVARAPSFTALRYIDAGVEVRAVIALGVTPEAGGPTVIAGGPFFGDGWFVRAALLVADAGPQVCFGVLAAPAGDCLAVSGGAVETRLIGAPGRRTIVGVVSDDRIAEVRVIVNGTSNPVIVEQADVVRVQGGYRVFAWRAPAAGTAHLEGLTRDGEVVDGVTVSVA
jgi:hypothetical protein